MRIITTNVNGIRSARKKGFFDWILSQDADFICIQETRAQISQLDDIFFPDNFHCFYNDSEKKGYREQQFSVRINLLKQFLKLVGILVTLKQDLPKLILKI